MSRRLIGLRMLGAARAEAFLRAARTADCCFAVGLLVSELDSASEPDLPSGPGLLLEKLLSDRTSGYFLDVTSRGRDRFEISFGCHPGPLTGDGATWDVVFDTAGRVVSCEERTRWIS